MKFSKAEREVFRRMGKKGGAARAASLTPKERRELARHAATARWAKTKPKTAANIIPVPAEEPAA